MSADTSDFLTKDDEKTFSERFIERCQKQPFLVGGWFATLGALAYGAYRYKAKGPSISTSVFSVQLRVFAQGAIVSSLLLGMMHQMYLEHFKNKDKKQIAQKD